ncbi:hypothetical protein AUK22_06535 [bacterium CG2_30_54_10]|nr:MAG: hypothetical protein AUK22_06535 [bacterium CG2_30_54_10]
MPDKGWKPEMILWDLDGTLAYWSSLRVIGHLALAYIRRLALDVSVFAAIVATARAYCRMLGNPGPTCNDRFFNRLMAASLSKSEEEMAAATREMLATPEVEQAVGWFFRPIPEARELIRKLVAKREFRHAVATSPVMPSNFNRQRLAMGGFRPSWFVHVTGSELYSSQKGDPRFFRELLSHVNLPPEKCLMVGNDLGKDVVSKAAGIPMFLLRTKFTRVRESPFGLRPDWEGGYCDLGRLLGLE